MDKKLITWGIVAVVAIVVIAGIFWMNQNNYSFTPQESESPVNNAPKETENSQATGGTGTSNYPVVAANLSYTDAVRIYADKRIQFNETCVPTPTSPTFKKGTTIMLDNRGSKAKTVSLDGKAISLSAYGFKLVTLTTTASLPHTIMLDCGNGQNNATILLQQ